MVNVPEDVRVFGDDVLRNTAPRQVKLGVQLLPNVLSLRFVYERVGHVSEYDNHERQRGAITHSGDRPDYHHDPIPHVRETELQRDIEIHRV